MSWFTKSLTSSLGKKFIMAMTGFLLGSFLLVHAAGNTSILFGRNAFISYSEHLHSLGFLIGVAEILLLALFLAHIITGFILFLENYRARASRYAVKKNAGGRTWGSVTMPYTGLVILGFIIIHLLNVHFTDHNRSIADIVAAVLHNPLFTVLYSIGLVALTLHVSHGFWSMFQSMGVNHPKYDQGIRTGAWIFCGIIVAVFIIIVLLLLVNSNILA